MDTAGDVMIRDGLVTIPQKRYKQLLDAEDMLSALEKSGVDNWEWYGEAMDLLESWRENG